MAGFTNAASYIAPALQGVSLAANTARIAGNVLGVGSSADDVARSSLRAQQDQALQQLQFMQDEQVRQANENAAAERAKIATEAQNAENTRRAALKRAVARQRAAYGASGIEANSSGSAQAVLLGLFDESEEEKNQRDKLDTLRLSAIDQDVDQRSRLNVLQRTQLAEKQRLQQSLVGYGNTSTVLGRLFDAL